MAFLSNMAFMSESLMKGSEDGATLDVVSVSHIDHCVANCLCQPELLESYFWPLVPASGPVDPGHARSDCRHHVRAVA